MSKNNFFDQNDVVEVNQEMNPGSSSFFEQNDVIEAPALDTKPSNPEDDMNWLQSAVFKVGQGVEAIPEMAPNFLKGLEQGTTFGGADELGGVIGAGLEAISPTDQAPDESKMDYLKRMYAEYRDAARGRYKQAEEQSPGAYMAGDIAGGFLLPGAAAKTATKALGTGTKAAAAIGAGTGVVEGAGRTEADLTSFEGLQDVGVSTVLGGGLGAVAGKIASKFTPEALEQASKKAAQESNISALKAIGATSGDFTDELRLNTSKRGGLDSAKGTGSTLVEQDLIKFKQSPAQIKSDIYNKMDEVGRTRIQPTAQKLDELGKDVPLRNFVDEVDNFKTKSLQDLEASASGNKYSKASDKAVYKSMDDAHTVLMEELENALESPNRISELTRIRRELQSQVNWADPQASSYNEFLVKMQANVNNLIDDMSKKINPSLGREMKEANKIYSNLISANDIAGRDLAKDLSSNKMAPGFRDWLGAGVISNISNVPLLGPAAIAGKKVIEGITGKTTGKMLNTLDAYRQAKKAPALAERAANYGGKDAYLASGALTGAIPGAIEAITDDQRSEQPYEKTKNMSSYIEKADEQQLASQANQIRQQYGKDGEKLALTLEKISQKDGQGRRALLFGIMQDPANRKMLGIDQK